MLLPSLEWRTNPFNLETSELKVLNISNSTSLSQSPCSKRKLHSQHDNTYSLKSNWHKMLLSQTIFAVYQRSNVLNLLFYRMESYLATPTLTSVAYRTLYKSKYLAIVPFLSANPTCREIEREYFGTNK